MSSPRVRTGLDVLRSQGFAPLKGLRIGLVSHAAAVDSNIDHIADLLARAPGVKLAAVFGPEHGYNAAAQDLIGVDEGSETSAGFRVHSLYGDSFASLTPTDEMMRGLDALVIDMQDVGSRYYTFPTTMLFCMKKAGELGIKSFVLDRPNPINGDVVEGPTLDLFYQSFIGWHPVATRHGLTVGELMKLYQVELKLKVDLEVIRCEGLRRNMDFEDTGLPWVLPSPNMPTVDTAYVYPGQCLIEGTILSEGRGTTRPFELCGGPGVDGNKMAARLNDEKWPGAKFRAVSFQPTFQKAQDQICGGVQMHVTDRKAFQPVRVGLAVIAALRDLGGKSFDWRRDTYEFVSDRLAIDLLFGSDRERKALEAGKSPKEIIPAWEAEEEAFRRRRKQFLLYD